MRASTAMLLAVHFLTKACQADVSMPQSIRAWTVSNLWSGLVTTDMNLERAASSWMMLEFQSQMARLVEVEVEEEGVEVVVARGRERTGAARARRRVHQCML